jgi:hypothetical protein
MHALFFALGLAAATVHAGPPAPAPRHIDVDEDEVVEGGLQGAQGDALLTRKQARFGTLLKLRTDFVPELVKSGE